MRNKQGWYKESYRHSLASRGIHTVGSVKTEVPFFTGVDLPEPKYQYLKNIKHELNEKDVMTINEFIKNKPEYRELFHNYEVVYIGKDDMGASVYYHFSVLPKGYEYNPDDSFVSEPISFGQKPGFTHIPKKPGLVYRGMSYQEYQNALRNGYFRSRGIFNIGETQEDSNCGSLNPETAENYAGWFTWEYKLPTEERPSYVVAFEDNDNWYFNREMTGSETEKQYDGPIPIKDVREVYEFNIEKFKPGRFEILSDYMGTRIGGGHKSGVEGKWERVV